VVDDRLAMSVRGPECSTCNRPDVGDIHRALDAQESQRSVAKRFGINEATLRFHLKHREEREREKAAAAKAAARAPKAPDSSRRAAGGPIPLDDLESRIVQLADTADRFRKEVENAGYTPRERGQCLSQAVAAVRAMMETAEKLAEGRETRILSTPEWSALRGRLVELLAPFPEALAAVETGLREDVAA